MVKLLILSNFTIFYNVFLKLFFFNALKRAYMGQRVNASAKSIHPGQSALSADDKLPVDVADVIISRFGTVENTVETRWP